MKSYRELKQFLGRQDAVLELHELALREFRMQAEESGDIAAFLQTARDRHNIKVDTLELEPVQRELGRIRILLAIGAVERFLHQFSEEANPTGQKRLFDKGASLDDHLQKCQSLFTAKSADAQVLCIMEYFAAVRNEAAHPFDARQHLGQVSAKARKAKDIGALELLSQSYGLSDLPERSTELDFQQYLACSKICKDFAFAVCRSAAPEFRDLPSRLKWKDRFSHLRSNPERHLSAIVSDIRTHCCLEEGEAVCLAKNLKEL